MGTLLRHGSDGAEAALPAADRQRRAAPAGLRRHRAERRLRDHPHRDDGRARRATTTSSTARRSSSRASQQSDLMLLLARTTPYDELSDKTRGLSACSWSICARRRHGQLDDPAARHDDQPRTPTELFFNDLEIPAENLIGEEGKGFRYIIDGRNAERILIASECDRRRPLVRRARRQLRQRAGGLRPADRRQPGRAVPDRPGLRPRRGGRPDALQGGRLVRRRPALRRRGEHGQAARRPRRPGRRPTPAWTPTAATAAPPSTTSSASSARPGCSWWRRSATTWCWRSSASTCSACRRSY